MADHVTTIKHQLGVFLSKEVELAKAELGPAAKHAGVGTGMLAISLGFALHAVWMFVIALAALFTWLMTLTGLSLALSLIFGFLIATVVSLVLAGIFALVGLRRYKKIKAPEATIAEAKSTIKAISDGWSQREDPAMPERRPNLGVVPGETA
ncbi:phage holin family protein [uncultured Tessaracoccus sp.]|uniref:phage holin family protein n=1 Tax=uncultured Tessaracoccus sp. TaxID=905023 RepID=UPI0025FD7E9E|nr:phage holin family protein [uncultured Tessaracoccus sp.]